MCDSSSRLNWILCVLLSCGLFITTDISANTSDSINSQKINQQPSDTLVLGRLVYRKRITIVSHFNGMIHKMLVKSGEQVAYNQSLVEVHGIEPGLKPMVVKNHRKDAKVTGINFNEGEFVSKHQTIMTLSRMEDLVVDSDLLATKLGLVHLGKAVTVIIPKNSPINKPVKFKGIINEMIDNVEDAITPIKIRIKLDFSRCTQDLVCEDTLRTGTLVFIRF